MRWSEIGGQECSIARTLSVIGDRWTLLVLREAFMRIRRFEDFQQRTGAPRPILAERLKALVDDGVLERESYCDHPSRYEYRLTAKGLDLYPVIVTLMTWGDQWMAGSEGPPVGLRHNQCGHVVRPSLACPDCGEWVGPHDTTPIVREGAWALDQGAVSS
ncbi:MAG TPA: helix-turn-helix domain-containing protein [Acidimicrobiales bacterium]|jgi:DNA-binding HxlR family transcriptional regulator